MPGVNLNRCTLEDPKATWDEIISQVKAAYDLGYIHGDLSEYNIMISDDSLWIIDWPQWVAPDHVNAEVTLRHDLETVAEFFRKKYQIEPDVEAAVSYIKSA